MYYRLYACCFKMARSLICSCGLVAALLASLLLSSCSAPPKAKLSASQARLDQACAKNQLLQKYDCDMQQVQSAALLNDPDAEYALGYLYYYGLGTPQDQANALTWMNKAAAQGQPLAQQALQMLQQQSRLASATLKQAKAPVTAQAKAPLSVKPKAPVIAQAKAPLSVKPKAPVIAQAKAAAGVQTKPSVAAQAQPAVVTACDLRYGQRLRLSSASTLQAATAQSQSYTLQWLGVEKLLGAQQFVRQQARPGLAIYQASLHGQPWYVVVYGRYADLAKARQAQQCLRQSAQLMLAHNAQQKAQQKAASATWARPLHGLQAFQSAPSKLPRRAVYGSLGVQPQLSATTTTAPQPARGLQAKSSAQARNTVVAQTAPGLQAKSSAQARNTVVAQTAPGAPAQPVITTVVPQHG